MACTAVKAPSNCLIGSVLHSVYRTIWNFNECVQLSLTVTFVHTLMSVQPLCSTCFSRCIIVWCSPDWQGGAKSMGSTGKRQHQSTPAVHGSGARRVWWSVEPQDCMDTDDLPAALPLRCRLPCSCTRTKVCCCCCCCTSVFFARYLLYSSQCNVGPRFPQVWGERNLWRSLIFLTTVAITVMLQINSVYTVCKMLYKLVNICRNYRHMRWCSDATVRALDLRSTCRGFKFYSGQSCVTTFCKLFTPYRPRGGDALWLGR